jgi:hypothetical protein
MFIGKEGRVRPRQLSIRLLNDDNLVWFGKNAAPT